MPVSPRPGRAAVIELLAPRVAPTSVAESRDESTRGCRGNRSAPRPFHSRPRRAMTADHALQRNGHLPSGCREGRTRLPVLPQAWVRYAAETYAAALDWFAGASPAIVGHRFGFARTPSAGKLRPGAVARGVPESIYFATGRRSWTRGCCGPARASRSQLTHSRPGRPQRRESNCLVRRP